MSEDLTLEAFLEFLSSVEAGIASARAMIKTDKIGYDMSKIAWVEAEGTKGLYEKTDDVNNNDYKALRKALKEHGGKFRKDGYFLWVFQNGTTIGRKRK